MRKIRFAHKRNKGCWGMAYPQEWRIELDPALSDQALLDIAIHEAIHVVAPDLSEEATDRIGRHCGELLWRLGFRREDEGA